MTPLPETLLRARAWAINAPWRHPTSSRTEHECHLATKVDHITAANPTGALHLFQTKETKNDQELSFRARW